MSVRDRLRELVEARPDLSLASLSRGAGKSHSYLQQFIERESPRTLPEDVRAYIAKRLGIEESVLKDSNKINPQKTTTAPLPKKGVPHLKNLSMVSAPEDLLKVLGMAEGGKDGWNLFNGDVVEYITRPDNLKGVPGAYAVYVIGDSMVPRYEQGERVHVHPGRPVQPGAYVLVQRRPAHEGEPPLAVVKRLVRRSGSKVILAQLNPKKEFEIPAGEIVSIHKIVGSSEA